MREEVADAVDTCGAVALAVVASVRAGFVGRVRVMRMYCGRMGVVRSVGVGYLGMVTTLVLRSSAFGGSHKVLVLAIAQVLRSG